MSCVYFIEKENPMKRWAAFLFIIFTLCLSMPSYGADIESRLKALEDTIQQQGETIKEQHKIINELREELNNKKPQETAGTVKEEAEKPKAQAASGLFGASALSNPNISLVLDTFVYSSNLTEEELENRSIPGFTTEGLENRKGFSLEAAELFLFAPVDPYFNLYATIPVTEEGVELEEAFFVTTSLPHGLQAKGGKFKSSFGRINSQHPHAWDFADIPLPYRAFMGGEGVIEKGAQVTFFPALPFYTLLGAEVLQGENEILFGEDAKSGPHAYTFFAKASFDLTDDSTILFGPSVMTGKTKTGSIEEDTEFEGDSRLYGFELTYKWKPSRGRNFTVQSEYLYRTQEGDLSAFDENGDALLDEDGEAVVDTLKRAQDGAYIQAVYGWDRWRLGARYDVLDLFKDEYQLSGEEQDFDGKPWRGTGMLEFHPTEFSRIKLQYNHDKSARNEETNHEWWLQFIMGIGAHAAHPF